MKVLSFIQSPLVFRIKKSIVTNRTLNIFSLRLFNFLSLLSGKSKFYAENLMDTILNKKASSDKKKFIELHKKIKSILKEQKRAYPKEKLYLHGISHYQGLNLLHIPGARITEDRFKEYDLHNLFKADDTILDLGCNNGFILIYASYLFGSHTFGVDHNPYSIKVGQACANYLNLNNKVNLFHTTIDDFANDISNKQRFSKIISFATHWTNDQGYKKQIYDHLRLVHNLLKEKGLLLFETHMSHSDEVNHQSILKECEGMFLCLKHHYFNDVNRRYYILQKL